MKTHVNFIGIDISKEHLDYCLVVAGVYQAHLVSFLYEKDLSIWLENPTQIKFSMGLQRGRNDKIDAKRIAIYAFKNCQDLKLWTPKRYKITFLYELLALKDRLVRTRSSLVVPIGEQKPFWDSKLSAEITPYSEKVIVELNKQITAIEKKIQEEIDNNEQIKSLFKTVTSVPGVGKKQL